MKLKVITTILLVATLSGCATQREFKGIAMYHEPITHLERDSHNTTVAFSDFSDSRSGREIDQIFEKPPIDSLKEILMTEMDESGMLLKGSNSDASYTINGELKKLSWEVPGHEGKVKAAFTVSLLTGGLGGLAYGSTKTPVYGEIELKLSVTRNDGSTLLEKTYSGKSEEKMALLKSDTPNTMSMVVGKSLNIVIKEFIEDLDEALAAEPDGGHNSDNSAASIVIP